MAEQPPTPIAVIGIGCRLPGGVTNTETLWELLAAGKNTWSPVPARRFNEAAFYHPNPDNNGTNNHRGGHFLEQDVAAFDAAFFGVSPAEAKALDPQQRLLLEVTYEAFENAGLSLEQIRGSDTAVYAALFTRDYDRNLFKDPLTLPKYQTTGTGDAIISNRISYTFDLRGPSLDTGCSGSIVALHQACQSLRVGETSMAVAAGVNLILSPDQMTGMSNLHMLSDTGRSYPFDSRGAGYGRGEGVTSVVLKRLHDALQAGDNVRAIIRNTAVSQDGNTNGITLPSQQAQERLQTSIYRQADLDPGKTGYVEAHGTGTVAGDRAELYSIVDVFCGSKRSKTNELYLGSIKSNIGHLESSSGLAGFIKTCLILEKGLIPPMSDFRNLKAGLVLGTSMKVPTETTSWPAEVRRASVNSFGYGGTNAHVILESASESIRDLKKREIEPLALPVDISNSRKQLGKDYLPGLASKNAITPAKAAPSRPGADVENPLLFVLSASSEPSLIETATKLRRWAFSRIDLPAFEHALAYTLADRRSMMQCRYSTVATDRSELMDALSQDSPQPIRIAEELQVAFIFTGQGAQWYAMGRELLSFESPFSASIQKSDMILQAFGTSWSLQNELLKNQVSSRMNESQIAQPASTALQIALVDLLASINISPRMVLGHSSGEIGAAYAAGIIPHEQALRLSYCRSQIASICKTSGSSRGAMLAVGLGEKEVLPFLTTTANGLVEVACVNSPSSTTLSGDEAAILEIEKVLSGRHIFCRRLNVDIAYHSQHMRQVADRYRCLLGNMKVQDSRNDVDFVSSVTAQQKVRDFDTSYWVDNLVSKVRFQDALEECCRNQTRQSTFVFVEIGPHSSLSGPIRQTLSHTFNDLKYRYLPTLERNRNALRSVLVLGGKLWELGHQVDIAAANSLTGVNGKQRVLQDLPSYSWDHSQAYWFESRLSREHNQRQRPYHELLGVRIPGMNSIAPSWRYIIDLDTLPWLADHVVDGQTTFPGAGYICMVVEAIHQLIGEKQPPQKFSKFILQNIDFLRALTVPPAPAKLELQICLQAGQFADTYCHAFRIVALSPDEVWLEHCRGQVTLELDHSADSSESETAGSLSNIVSFGKGSEEDIPINYSHDLSSVEIYQGLRVGGNLYGPCFAAIQALRLCETEAVGRIRVPKIADVMPFGYQQPHVIHPTTLDAIMHSALPLYAQADGQGSIMPVSIRHMAISLGLPSDPGQELIATTTLGAHDQRSASISIAVVGTGGLPKSEALLTISDLRIWKVGNAERISASGLSPSRRMTYRMIWDSDVELNSLSVTKPAVVMSRACFMRQLRFKYPHLSVLHLGLGNAKDIASDLGGLVGGTLPTPMCYHVVSETAESSERLRNLFKPGNSWLSFRSLDATQDLNQLHRNGETYDVIVCADPQKSLAWSESMMTAIRKLLRPSGRLVANFEVLTPSKRDEMQQIMLEKQLGDLAWFREANLDGVENEDANTGITLVSKSVDIHPQVFPQPVQIIAEDGPKAFASTLRASIHCEGIEAHLSTWSSLDDVRQAACIIIDNGQSPMLVRPSADRFKRIATMMGSSSAVLWISVHSSVEAARNPEKGLIHGFARSACAENEKLRFVHLDVQDAIEHCMPDLALKVTQLMSAALRSSGGAELVDEQQYIYRDGQILIPRLVPIEIASDWKGFPEKDSGLARHGKAFEDEIGPTDVEITLRAHSLSTMENSAGLASSSPHPRTEVQGFAGYVSAVGSNATRGFREGQLACAWTTRNDQHGNVSRIDCTQVADLPDSVPMALAATIPSNFASVYHVLIDIARLRQNQSILIHEADSDVGQIACSIARHIGAVVLATVSSGTGVVMLLEKLKLPKENVFIIRSGNLQRNLLENRVDKGADVVFNSVSTDPGPGIWDCICPLGIFIQVRRSSSQDIFSHVSSPSNKTLTIIAFDPAMLLVRNLERLPVLIDNVISMLESQDPATYPSAKSLVHADAEDFSEAKYNKNQNQVAEYDVQEHSRAKVLEFADPVFRSTEYHLDNSATYIIAGVLGDLGQKICRLLAQRGAKNILILSRKPLPQEQKRSLQDELRHLSRGVEVYTTVCDISDRSVVEEAVKRLRQDGLPPVKGIIQAAAVLQDSVLERMTPEDLLVPLRAKMDGTRNLNEAFQDSPLDFLIMLSSLSGIVGTRGQANYAAGNTYQDAFAMNRDLSKTNFLSINLGMIESSTAYGGSQGRARSQNLLRQGLSPVKDAELLNLLNYAMSPEARKEQLGQVAIGMNGSSIAGAAHPTPTMKSAMFVHVRGASRKQDKGSSGDNGVSLKDSIAGADSGDDASHIIAEATGRQLACLIGLEPGTISLMKPVADYGVDSLTAIELKNWISLELGTTVHASEILDEPSLKTLGKKLASRSRLVSKPSSDNPGSQLTDHTTSHGRSSTQMPVVYNGNRGGNAEIALPKLPLPDLSGTLELYLDSARPFLTNENFTHTSSVISGAQASQCRNIQERLELCLSDPQLDNWHFDLQVNGIYLRRRAPIHPYGTFYGSHLSSIEPHGQAGRAAIIAASAWQFKRNLDAGHVEDQYVNEELLCMDSLRWLFNTNRQPRHTLDKICHYPDNDYLVALRKGHVFKILLTSNGFPATHTTLKAIFESVLERSNANFPAVATLTASDRDSWAVLRAKVISASTENRALIDMIEAAAFVVCLDDESPTTPSQRCNQLLLGNPANRWSDKSLQFVVCQNGVSGYICEHTMLDALSVRPLNAFITDAIAGMKPSSEVAKPSNNFGDLIEQYHFMANDYMDEEIVRVKSHFDATYSPAEFVRFEVPILNNGLLRAHKIPSKFGCQLAIQLASYLHYGQQYPSWETITTMTFHKGRLDWMQVVSQSLAAFCKLAAGSSAATTESLRLLREAAKAHTSTMTRITRGRGFAAHLEALREAVLEADEELPELFTDSTWELMQVTATRKIKTDASEGLMAQEAGFFMPDPESVWVHYEIGSEGCLFFVQGAVGLTEAYCEALTAAAEKIKNILEMERDLIAKSHYLIDPGDIICSAKIQPSAKDTQAIFNSLISDPFLPAANSWLDLHFEYDLLRHPAMISGSCRTSPLSSPLTPFQSPPQSVFPPTTTIPPPPTKHPPVCGSIRVVYDGTLHSKALCHCSDCRKISGGAYSVNLLVPTSALVLESGTPRSYTKDTDEGNRFTSFFCRDCGSTVWRESTGIPGIKFLKEGCLETMSGEKPTVEYYHQRRVEWMGKIEGAEEK